MPTTMKSFNEIVYGSIFSIAFWIEIRAFSIDNCAIGKGILKAIYIGRKITGTNERTNENERTTYPLFSIGRWWFDRRRQLGHEIESKTVDIEAERRDDAQRVVAAVRSTQRQQFVLVFFVKILDQRSWVCAHVVDHRVDKLLGANVDRLLHRPAAVLDRLNVHSKESWSRQMLQRLRKASKKRRLRNVVVVDKRFKWNAVRRRARRATGRGRRWHMFHQRTKQLHIWNSTLLNNYILLIVRGVKYLQCFWLPDFRWNDARWRQRVHQQRHATVFVDIPHVKFTGIQRNYRRTRIVLFGISIRHYTANRMSSWKRNARHHTYRAIQEIGFIMHVTKQKTSWWKKKNTKKQKRNQIFA